MLASPLRVMPVLPALNAKLMAQLTCHAPAPVQYSDLSKGEHTFRVRAVSTTGAINATPTTYSWQVSASEGLLLTWNVNSYNINYRNLHSIYAK